MADFYIDPSAGVDGDGQVGTPFNTWASAVPLQANNTYLQRAGTNEALASSVVVNNDNITLGAYDSGAQPILRNYEVSTNAGDWTLVGGEAELWQFTGNTTEQMFILGLGALDTNVLDAVSYGNSGGSQDVFSVYGQYSWSTGDPSTLYLYSDVNPVTKWGSIYYGYPFASACFQLGQCTNVELSGFHFLNSGAGASVQAFIDNEFNGNHRVHGNTYDQCARGLYIAGITFNDLVVQTGVRVYDNHFINSYGPAIAWSGSFSDLWIYNNTVDNWGQSVSSGGIYGSGTAHNRLPTRVFGNEVHGGTYGRLWTVDGDSIYVDNYGDNTLVYANDVPDVGDPRIALYRDNSGGRNKWYSNQGSGGAYLIKVSDSLVVGNAYVEVYNNIALDVAQGININVSTSPGGGRCLNNICVGLGTDQGWVNESVPTMTEDYNIFYNFTGNSALGTNSSTADPELWPNSYLPGLDSSAIGAGTSEVLPLTDYTGADFTAPVTIGANSAEEYLMDGTVGIDYRSVADLSTVFAFDTTQQYASGLSYNSRQFDGSEVFYELTGAGRSASGTAIRTVRLGLYESDEPIGATGDGRIGTLVAETTIVYEPKNDTVPPDGSFGKVGEISYRAVEGKYYSVFETPAALSYDCTVDLTAEGGWGRHPAEVAGVLNPTNQTTVGGTDNSRTPVIAANWDFDPIEEGEPPTLGEVMKGISSSGNGMWTFRDLTKTSATLFADEYWSNAYASSMFSEGDQFLIVASDKSQVFNIDAVSSRTDTVTLSTGLEID